MHSQESYPLPEDPALAQAAAVVRDAQHWAWIFDHRWRLVYAPTSKSTRWLQMAPGLQISPVAKTRRFTPATLIGSPFRHIPAPRPRHRSTLRSFRPTLPAPPPTGPTRRRSTTAPATPPAQTSGHLTVGTADTNGQAEQSVGSVRLVALPGNPSTPGRRGRCADRHLDHGRAPQGGPCRLQRRAVDRPARAADRPDLRVRTDRPGLPVQRDHPVHGDARPGDRRELPLSTTADTVLPGAFPRASGRSGRSTGSRSTTAARTASPRRPPATRCSRPRGCSRRDDTHPFGHWEGETVIAVPAG